MWSCKGFLLALILAAGAARSESGTPCYEHALRCWVDLAKSQDLSWVLSSNTLLDATMTSGTWVPVDGKLQVMLGSATNWMKTYLALFKDVRTLQDLGARIQSCALNKLT